MDVALLSKSVLATTRWPISFFIVSICAQFFTAIAVNASNDLHTSPSPYLRLHATDPVEWRRWNEDALEEARQTGRPIFLSIGYLACHWCHVMQKESFADTKTAKILNTRFIPILVDREERPDIDELFQQLALRLGIQTGWPLNLVLTPEGHPFFGGVYFPPEPRAGILSFREVLAKVEELYQDDPKGVADYATSVINRLSLETLRGSGQRQLTRTELKTEIILLATEVDDFYGGFGDGAKFPRFPALRALWRGYLRSGNNALAEVVTTSIEAMVNGAVMDQVGGGFFRYTVDPLWRQPHFEKMLDVNAMAIIVLTEVWQETRDPKLAKAIEEVVRFLLAELRLPNGVFSSALDADSEGREGAYYVWDAEEIRDALGPDYRLFAQAFGLAAPEEGVDRFVLHRSAATIHEIARREGLTLAETRHRLTGALNRLKILRSDRPRPVRDEKVIASLNGLAVTALTNAGMAFGRPEWVTAGRQAFYSTLETLWIGEDLHHSSYDGRPSGPANLEDRAFLARAAIDLFMAEGNHADLDIARALARSVADFEDTGNGGYFITVQPAARDLPRLRTARDTASPSGNAILGEVFASLYYLTGDKELLEKAERLIMGFSQMAVANSLDLAGILTTADMMNDAVQIIIVGEKNDPDVKHLTSAVWQVSTPGRIFQIIAPGTKLPDGHPAQFKDRVDDKATVYVCVGKVCSLPNTDPKDLQKTIQEFRQTWN